MSLFLSGPLRTPTALTGKRYAIAPDAPEISTRGAARMIPIPIGVLSCVQISLSSKPPASQAMALAMSKNPQVELAFMLRFLSNNRSLTYCT